ncbi:MAG: ubiquitin family protein [Ignavibacteria bacterium]|nr:ubiquitin family protein [Ignavibacteria bacterium]
MGKTLVVDANESLTIGELKQIIESKTKLPAVYQKLSHCGK